MPTSSSLLVGNSWRHQRWEAWRRRCCSAARGAACACAWAPVTGPPPSTSTRLVCPFLCFSRLADTTGQESDWKSLPKVASGFGVMGRANKCIGACFVVHCFHAGVHSCVNAFAPINTVWPDSPLSALTQACTAASACWGRQCRRSRHGPAHGWDPCRRPAPLWSCTSTRRCPARPQSACPLSTGD